MRRSKSSPSKYGLIEVWERCVNGTGVFFSWILLVMTLLVAFNVTTRYAFGFVYPWGDDVAAFLLVAIVFGGLGYTAFHNGHIRVDVLTLRLPLRKQKFLQLLVDGIGLAVLVIVTREAYSYVWMNFVSHKQLMGLILYPAYLPQAIIPIGLTLFCLVVAHQVYKIARELLWR